MRPASKQRMLSGNLLHCKQKPAGWRAFATDSTTTLPAPIDGEYATTALGDPHASAIPTPGATFNARRTRFLALQVDLAATTNIDLTEPVAVADALATNSKILVPTRT